MFANIMTYELLIIFNLQRPDFLNLLNLQSYFEYGIHLDEYSRLLELED
jgi:hypothetical protein